MLANLPSPTAEQFWPVLLSLAALAHLGVMALKGFAAWKSLKGEAPPLNAPQPFAVVKHQDNVKASEFDGFREEVRAQFMEMKRGGENRVATITQGFDADISHVCDKIEKLGAEVRANIKEDFKDVFHRLNEHGERISALEATAKIKLPR